MAIVQKGSRKIVVDGIEYRWRIRQKQTNNQISVSLDGRDEISVSVEQGVEDDGAILVINWTQKQTKTSAPLSITPSMVADAIRRARQDGWQPLQAGQPFSQRNLL